MQTVILMKSMLIGAAALTSFASTAQAQDLHFIMCGGEIRAADQDVVDAFVAANEGVTVNIEAVPWGTCQDKSLTLASAGDPPSISYMGSRTLRQLANNDLIVPSQISDDTRGAYQPGILNTVTVEGVEWGYPRAFSTKALFINCGLAEAAAARRGPARPVAVAVLAQRGAHARAERAHSRVVLYESWPLTMLSVTEKRSYQPKLLRFRTEPD